MFPLHPLFLGFLVALGVGLLIGIDRERQKGEGPDPSRRRPAHLHPGGAAGRRRHRRRRRAAAGGRRAGRRGLRRPVLLARARQRSRPHHRDGAGARRPCWAGWRSANRLSPPALGVVVAVLLAARSALHRFVPRRADRPGDPQPADLRRRHPGGAAAAARPCDRPLRRAQPAHDLDRGDPGDGGERAGLHRGSPGRRALRPAAGRPGRGLHLEHASPSARWARGRGRTRSC